MLRLTGVGPVLRDLLRLGLWVVFLGTSVGECSSEAGHPRAATQDPGVGGRDPSPPTDRRRRRIRARAALRDRRQAPPPGASDCRARPPLLGAIERIRRHLRDAGLDENDFLEGDELRLDDESPFRLVYVLNEDFFRGGLTDRPQVTAVEQIPADRSSIARSLRERMSRSLSGWREQLGSRERLLSGRHGVQPGCLEPQQFDRLGLVWSAVSAAAEVDAT